MVKTSKKINKDINFLYEIGSLRFVQRTWRQFHQQDVANNAEHMFRVAWIALIIARHEGVKNDEKILKLALMHDVGESRTPDTNYVSKIYSSRDEVKAISHIFGETSLHGEFEELFEEYEKRETIESKIVKDADNLDVDMELQEMAVRGSTIKKNWPRVNVRKNLFTQTAKQIFDEIQTSNPHEWHLLTHDHHTSEKDRK